MVDIDNTDYTRNISKELNSIFLDEGLITEELLPSIGRILYSNDILVRLDFDSRITKVSRWTCSEEKSRQCIYVKGIDLESVIKAVLLFIE